MSPSLLFVDFCQIRKPDVVGIALNLSRRFVADRLGRPIRNSRQDTFSLISHIFILIVSDWQIQLANIGWLKANEEPVTELN